MSQLCLPCYTAVGCTEEKLPVGGARFLPEADGILTHPGAERQKLPFRRLPSAIFSRQVLWGSLTFSDLTDQLRRAPARSPLSHTPWLTGSCSDTFVTLYSIRTILYFKGSTMGELFSPFCVTESTHAHTHTPSNSPSQGG